MFLSFISTCYPFGKEKEKGILNGAMQVISFLWHLLYAIQLRDIMTCEFQLQFNMFLFLEEYKVTSLQHPQPSNITISLIKTQGHQLKL